MLLGYDNYNLILYFIFYGCLKFKCTKTDVSVYTVQCTLYSVSSSLMYNFCIQLKCVAYNLAIIS